MSLPVSLRRTLLGLGVLAAVVAGYAVLRSRAGAKPLSLVDAYATTVRRSSFPDVEAFSIYDATLAGETRRAVYARPPSRITWKITVPPGSELHAWLALRPEAWSIAGDGVVFRIGVSDGRVYRDSLNRKVHPFAVAEDRRWIPVSIDLSPYAGQSVDLIFNTENGTPKDGGAGQGDLALWGEPIVVPAR